MSDPTENAEDMLEAAQEDVRYLTRKVEQLRTAIHNATADYYSEGRHVHEIMKDLKEAERER